jgi:quercetin 2,3-dioxygenase
MDGIRSVKNVFAGNRTRDGAGVRLTRVLGYHETKIFDPFLMLDYFKSENPDDYIRGFPWHPHRGIETVTYMLDGSIEHGDSMGNKGVIHGGDCQYMTAGSGIIHQEMPLESSLLRGIQLWVNLPKKDKMIAPYYNDISAADIPVVDVGSVLVRVVCGEFGGVLGPVKGVSAKPRILDLEMSRRGEIEIDVPTDDCVFAFIFEGEVSFSKDGGKAYGEADAVLLEGGDRVFLKSNTESSRLLLLSGKPLNETIAWRGPIVMNTDEELEQAFSELENGTFVR